MKLIHQKAPSKAWRLIRDLQTGDILTGDLSLYAVKHDIIASRITKAHDEIAAGRKPEVFNYYCAGSITFDQYEQLDHIPYCRGKLKFKTIHAGTSSVQIVFVSSAGGRYCLEGDSTDDFFIRVGQGKIKMDSDGFYEFNFGYVKKSAKVFITLEADDMHV